MKKLSNTEAELKKKKVLLVKKTCSRIKMRWTDICNGNSDVLWSKVLKKGPADTLLAFASSRRLVQIKGNGKLQFIFATT